MDVLRGRCWKLGDSVSNDQLIASKFVFDYDLAILTKHIMADVIPEFASQAKAGDVIVAGENFAHGSLHIHPFLALKAMGVGPEIAKGAMRLSIGWDTNESDISRFLEVWKGVYQKLGRERRERAA